MTPLLCACAVVITLETQNFEKVTSLRRISLFNELRYTETVFAEQRRREQDLSCWVVMIMSLDLTKSALVLRERKGEGPNLPNVASDLLNFCPRT